MPHSVNRFLTTHTGSLPRPADLIEMMYAKEEGKPVDREALAQRIKSSVGEVVGKQRKAGLDIVNDGEMSKPSYATYVKDRLSGFGGTSNSFVYQDLVEFPNMAKRVFGDPGRSRRKTPACNGPIAVADPDAVRRDVDNLQRAVGEGEAERAFMTAASPGGTRSSSATTIIRAKASISQRSRMRCGPNTKRSSRRASTFKSAARTWRWAGISNMTNLELSEFRKRAAEHVEAMNGALANIPADRVRMHLCWGNYEGPHHCDVPLADIVDVVLSAKPAALSLEAANPRHAHEWAVFETTKLPEGKVLIPGVIESKSNFIEHPQLIANRISNYAKLVGRENVIAGSDCGYGTWVGQAAVDPDIVWAKFAALAEGARIASERFWR
jgi:5-methyltetrahydropteroyltriglutamate--homocysteine methyltransferase